MDRDPVCVTGDVDRTMAVTIQSATEPRTGVLEAIKGRARSSSRRTRGRRHPGRGARGRRPDFGAMSAAAARVTNRQSSASP